MDCILTAWRLNLPESRGKLAVSEKCTGLLHSRTAPGIGNRPNGLSIKNWEGFCKAEVGPLELKVLDGECTSLPCTSGSLLCNQMLRSHLGAIPQRGG